VRLDHVGVLVADLEAACAFARDVLELGEPDAFRDDAVGLSAAFFPLGQGRLELLRFDEPGDRLPPGVDVSLDHVAVVVDDLEAEADRLRAKGLRFQGPLKPDELQEPFPLRGRRHLWTKPESGGGFMLQMTEAAD
jgi:lactoylglutathione lyase